AVAAPAGDVLGAEVALVDLQEGLVGQALEVELRGGPAADRAGRLEVVDGAAGAGAEHVAGRPYGLHVRRGPRQPRGDTGNHPDGESRPAFRLSRLQLLHV